MKTTTDNWKLTKLMMVLLVTLGSLGAHAEVVTERYKNDSDITNLFLWSDDPANMTFADVDLTDQKLVGWNIALNVNFGEALVLEGPEVKKSNGKFDIDFNYMTAPFTFQYAEVLFDTTTGWIIQDTGNIEYDGKKLDKPTVNPLSAAQYNDIDSYFSPPAAAVVPVPSSVVLMVSAIGFMGVATRRESAKKTTDSNQL